MTKYLRIVAPLLATAALAAGCGGGSDNTTSGYGNDGAAAQQPAAATTDAAKTDGNGAAKTDAGAAAKTEDAATADGGGAAEQSAAKTVELTGSTFQPSVIDLKVGETVTFVNQDEIPHTATAGDGAFDSGTLEAGGKFSFTAEQAGKIAYVCNFHPGMTGTINVT